MGGRSSYTPDRSADRSLEPRFAARLITYAVPSWWRSVAILVLFYSFVVLSLLNRRARPPLHDLGTVSDNDV
jgi:hypothetical protein